MQDQFDTLNHDIRTRHNDGLKIELIRNEHVRKPWFYLGTSRWNNLTIELRELELN